MLIKVLHIIDSLGEGGAERSLAALTQKHSNVVEWEIFILNETSAKRDTAHTIETQDSNKFCSKISALQKFINE